MDAFAKSQWSRLVLAAVVACWSASSAEAAPPVRRGTPGRLVARAAVAKHNTLREAPADEQYVDPAVALQPAEEFFPPDMPADDLPADDLPVEDAPGAAMPQDDVPAEDSPASDMPAEDMPAGDEPDEVAPLEPVPAEAAPYAAAPLLDDYPVVEPGASDYYDPNECASCGDDCCSLGCGECVDSCCGGGGRGCNRGCSGLTAGVEFTFVKPRFDRNVAFTIMNSNGDSFESFTEIEFDYAFDLAPRVWLGYAAGEGRGWRATYWQYDEEAETASSSPPPNGFGAIIPPEFGDVDIGTAIPTDVFTANSRLNAYTIDLEATQEASRGAWITGASYGVRFASMQQDYLARTTNSAGTQLGQIDYYRTQRGAGPTLALTAAHAITRNVNMFGTARGSVLFGDSDANFFGGEDQDLATAFNTTRVTTRDDVWTIGEIQVGIRWLGRRSSRGWQPFASGAAEGQSWNGAGNATSEDGTLGFVGFNIGIGVQR